MEALLPRGEHAHTAFLAFNPFPPLLPPHAADPSALPAVDDLIASLEQHMHSSRDANRQLRKELAAAAQLLPRLC